MITKANNEFKSKSELIENVSQQIESPSKLTKKIVRQTKVFTKDNIDNLLQSITDKPRGKPKIDWETFEHEIKEILPHKK